MRLLLRCPQRCDPCWQLGSFQPALPAWCHPHTRRCRCSPPLPPPFLALPAPVRCSAAAAAALLCTAHLYMIALPFLPLLADARLDLPIHTRPRSLCTQEPGNTFQNRWHAEKARSQGKEKVAVGGYASTENNVTYVDRELSS